MKVRARGKPTLAWSLWLATFGCCAAGLLITLALTRPLTLAVLAKGAADALAYPLGYATIGLLLSLRRPANPIGWLYAASGLAWSLSIPLDPWVIELSDADQPLPLAIQVAYVVVQPLWAPAITCGITLPLLLLPDGRLRSPSWRPVVAAAVAGAIVVVVAGSLQAGPPEETPIDNPLALGGVAGRIAGVASWVGVALFVASLVAALVCIVLRFRAARGVQRQQLRWVAAGATATIGTMLVIVPVVLSGIAPALPVVLSSLASLCVPVAVAVAILRYRLYDLDRIISRGLAYSLLTVLLGGGYAGIVVGLGQLVGRDSSLVVAGATLTVAAVVQPARRRIQAGVDRRFNRRRYDAAQTIAAFSGRLRQHVDLETLTAELLAVVEETMQPTHASLWARSPHALPASSVAESHEPRLELLASEAS